MKKKFFFENKFLTYGLKFFIAIGIFVLFYIIALATSFSIKKITNLNNKTKEYSKTLMYNFLHRITFFVIITIGILIAAVKLGFNVNSILVILGSIGIAIALCTKDFLAQCVSGLAILFFKYYEIRDFIKVNGESGNVVHFDLLNTIINTPQNVTVIIPNNLIIGSSFTNYSTNKEIFVSTDICISNNAKINYEEIMKKLEESIRKIPFVVNNNVKTKVVDVSGNGTKIAVQIRAKSTNYAKALDQLNFVVRNFMNNNNILMCDNAYLK